MYTENCSVFFMKTSDMGKRGIAYICIRLFFLFYKIYIYTSVVNIQLRSALEITWQFKCFPRVNMHEIIGILAEILVLVHPNIIQHLLHKYL